MSNTEAMEHVKAMDYQWSLNDSLITLDPGVMLPEGQPYKFQYVTMKMRIPVGTIIHLDDQTHRMLRRTHYRRHRYDDEYDGRMYKMTAKGLQCMDCADYDDDDDDYYDNDNDVDEISIDLGSSKDGKEKGGIHIKINDDSNVKETETVTISKDGKTIKTKVKKVGPVTITEEEEKK
jgi:hypothetical protein